MPVPCERDRNWRCSACGETHIDDCFSFAADFPDPYANLSRDDRETRALVGSDQCIIDGEQFFIRGCLELPILGTAGVFLWGLWTRVMEQVFDEVGDHWETPGREIMIGPYKGRLANELSIYPGSLNVGLTMEIRPVGQRPRFFLDECEHPMTVEQGEGISLAKAREYRCLLLRMADGS